MNDVEKVDVHREDFRTSDLENFHAVPGMRDCFKGNFVIKRTPRASKNLCQLLHQTFSKIVLSWLLCKAVRGEIRCTKDGVLFQKEQFLMVNLC